VLTVINILPFVNPGTIVVVAVIVSAGTLVCITASAMAVVRMVRSKREGESYIRTPLNEGGEESEIADNPTELDNLTAGDSVSDAGEQEELVSVPLNQEE